MFSEKIEHINSCLKELSKNNSFENATQVVDSILALLSIHSKGQYKLFSDSRNKISSNASWFVAAPGYADKKAAFIVAEDNDKNFDIKLFWMQRIEKSIINWLTALTPNFEDEEFYGSKNIGIDFIIPEKADKVLLVLTKNHVTRLLELQGELGRTQKEIFAKWEQPFDFSNKAQVHEILWSSLDFEPVNKKFYKELVTLFNELKQYLVDKKVHETEKDAAMFATRLFGRILFCWFLDKKGFINKEIGYFDPKGLTPESYYKERLENLFFNTLNSAKENRRPINGIKDNFTPYLNGGLFEAKPHDFYGDDKLSFPKGYFERLFDLLKHYNFTVDESSSTFQQVAIDPEMLGRIFENLLAEQNEDTGEQARKAKGAFYTPREIVDYMVKESLREYLKTKVEDDEYRDERIKQLLDTKDHIFRDQQRNYRRDLAPYKNKIIEALRDLRAIDPACGSGAFPIGILQALLKCFERLEGSQNQYDYKYEILQRNIYGVDIEPMAVEVSRLRAWLTLIVDEEDVNKVEPLPNLDFKFVCADSLKSLNDQKLQIDFSASEERYEKELIILRDEWFRLPVTTKPKEIEEKKKDLKTRFQKLLQEIENIDSNSKTEKINKLQTYKPFDSENITQFLDTEFMFGLKDGFDIVIGNPPYVSTKGVGANMKKSLEKDFGFADDLYNHFYFKGMELLRANGILTYISSKTFWTTQTKKNLRELLLKNKIIQIYDTANPFSSVMVDTCVVIVQKQSPNQNHVITFLDGKKNLSDPEHYTVSQNIYDVAANKVIFIPNEYNMKINERLFDKVNGLLNQWWYAISTSKNIEKNKRQLEEYRRNLKPGDITLLGLITEGGQGLATANNGKYVGVLDGTKWAENVKKQRPEKLLLAKEFCQQKSIRNKQDAQSFLDKLQEKGIRELFDDIKEKYGRDIFGRGWLYRIVALEEIATVDNLTEDEKLNGIAGHKTFVPYDKGDKDGNRWYAPTPYYIDWSKENVKFLKENSGKKGEGMPVVRNPQFYFREGFCWSDIHTINIKCRIKTNGIHDVKSMSLFSLDYKRYPEYYFVCILNSTFVSEYVFAFIKNTQTFQINDARLVPIIIPSSDQLIQFEAFFSRAYAIQKEKFAGMVSEKEAKQSLSQIQRELDELVEKMYLK